MSGPNWQDTPDWLIFAARASRSAADGGEGAVTRLADAVLRDDPEFARAVIARYVRSLVRVPKKRRAKKTRTRDEVLAACARLEAEGLSLRAIGERLGISHSTARRMLAEWQVRLPEMPAELVQLSHPRVTKATPSVTPPRSSDPNVIPLRRLA